MLFNIFPHLIPLFVFFPHMCYWIFVLPRKFCSDARCGWPHYKQAVMARKWKWAVNLCSDHSPLTGRRVFERSTLWSYYKDQLTLHKGSLSTRVQMPQKGSPPPCVLSPGENLNVTSSTNCIEHLASSCFDCLRNKDGGKWKMHTQRQPTLAGGLFLKGWYGGTF